MGVVLAYEPGRRIVYGSADAAPGVGEEPVPTDEQVTLEFWISRSTGDEPYRAFEGGGPGLLGWLSGLLTRLSRFFAKLLPWTWSRPPGKPQTVLNFRQTGFGEADAELFDAGWSMHFHVLQQYFDHFAGKAALTTAAMALHSTGREEAWATMRQAVGLPAQFEVGQPVRLAAPGLRPIEGVIDLVKVGGPLEAVSVRNNEEILQMCADSQCGGWVHRYQYVSNPVPLEAQRVEEAAQMQDWLQGQFAS